MAVTKQTYTATSTWTQAGLAGLFRDAFIDAGLMTAWYDEFVTGLNTVRVLRIEHDNTKAYGSSFYYFVFRQQDFPGVCIASGWDAANDVPAGTQFLDYHMLPQFVSGTGNQTPIIQTAPSTIANVFLDRFTSTDDAKQSWFVLRQGLNRSNPFTILHKDTSLHPWLDLDKGIVNGYSVVGASAASRQGYVYFQLQENIRRCLLTGQALSGASAGEGFHRINYSSHSYTGVGSQNDSFLSNLSPSITGGSVILPVAKSSVNPAFLVDYVPICSNLPWSPFTPTRLANDFGVYMHYADNTTAYGDRFIVQAGVNEWETLQFANNSTAVHGASPAFLARVV